jgi:hypothetical protein
VGKNDGFGYFHWIDNRSSLNQTQSRRLFFFFFFFFFFYFARLGTGISMTSLFCCFMVNTGKEEGLDTLNMWPQMPSSDTLQIYSVST